MRPHSILRATLLVAFATLAPAAARADGDPSASSSSAPSAPPSPAAVARARAHFQRGVKLYEEQDFRAALIEFRRAYETAPHWGVLYDIGQSSYELLDYAGALRAFERYLAEGGQGVPPARRTKVEQEITELRQRVGRLTIRTNLTGAEIAIDDEPVPRAQLAAPVVVSAGRRKVSASKPGQPPIVRYVDVAGGDDLQVALERADADGSPSVVEVAPASPAASAPPPAIASARAPASAPVVAAAPVAPAAEPSRAPSTFAWVSLGIAAAGLGVGATFGALALGDKASLDRACPNKACAPGDQDRIDALQRDAAVATVGFGVGVAALIAGAALIVAPSKLGDHPEAATARVQPIVSPFGAGLRGVF